MKFYTPQFKSDSVSNVHQSICYVPDNFTKKSQQLLDLTKCEEFSTHLELENSDQKYSKTVIIRYLEKDAELEIRFDLESFKKIITELNKYKTQCVVPAVLS